MVNKNRNKTYLINQYYCVRCTLINFKIRFDIFYIHNYINKDLCLIIYLFYSDLFANNFLIDNKQQLNYFNVTLDHNFNNMSRSRLLLVPLIKYYKSFNRYLLKK